MISGVANRGGRGRLAYGSTLQDTPDTGLVEVLRSRPGCLPPSNGSFPEANSSNMSRPFSHEAVRRLGEAVRAGDAVSCPECATPLDSRRVPPRPDVSYVRDRVWLVCPSCHRTAVVDRKAPT